MSVELRPFFEKADIRALMSDVGAGISLFAPLKLAVVASLLPSCTVHEGPPNYGSSKIQSKLIMVEPRQITFCNS